MKRREYGQPGEPIRVACDPRAGQDAQCMASRVYMSDGNSREFPPQYIIGQRVGPDYRPSDSVPVFEGPECSLSTCRPDATGESGAVEPIDAVLFDHRARDRAGPQVGGGVSSRIADHHVEILIWGEHLDSDDPPPPVTIDRIKRKK